MDIERDSPTSSQTSENDVPQRTVIVADIHQIQSPEEEAPQVPASKQGLKGAPRAGGPDRGQFPGTFDSFRIPGPEWSSTIRVVTDRPPEHAIHPGKAVEKPVKDVSVKKRKVDPVKYGNNLQKYIRVLLSERSEMRDQRRGNRGVKKLDRREAILQAEAMRYKIGTNIRKFREELDENN